MSSLYRRKYIKIFVKVTLFAFSFAWIACTSHFSFTSPIVDNHTQSSHTGHGDDSKTHSASCLDHTYQISARNQGNSFSGDIDASVIPTPLFTFDFSRLSLVSKEPLFYRSDQNRDDDLFLKHTVLRL
jgi:hypothetical protein